MNQATGLLILLLAVLVLIALAPAVLLRRRGSRRKVEPPRTAREKVGRAAGYLLRLLGFTLFSAVLVVAAALVLISYSGARYDMRPAPSEVEVPPDLSFAVEEVTFASEDGVTLAGWYVPPQNGATVILLHGYDRDRTEMTWRAGRLVAAGYGVLLYDERASGESGGDHRSFGWEDPADVAGALDYLDGLPGTDPERIGILGCSIGAQIAIQGAAASPQIAAVWADGPSGILFSDLRGPTNWYTLLGTPSGYLVDWFTALELGRDLPAPMTEVIGRIEPRPLMLVAGSVAHPLTGPESTSIQHYAAHAGPHAELWIIPEATHCDGPDVRPEEYAERLVGFFDLAFGIER